VRRLFLHLRRDGDLLRDEDGRLFADLAEARAEALATGREVVANRLGQGRRVAALHIEIQDQTGRVLAIMPLRDMMD
jgi:hypothetical protein